MGITNGGYQTAVAGGVGAPRFNAGAPTSGVDDVQTITGAATGGTYTFTFTNPLSGKVTTFSVPFNASAAAVQAAMLAMSGFPAGGVVCTGGALGTAPVVCTFGGALSGLPVTVMTVDNSAATGGVGSVVHTTTGVSGTARGAAKGAILTDTTTPKQYQNTGTAQKPTWTVVGTQT
jgi:hypothetical protein